jgi:retron-type reverse transcriptase
MLEPSFSDHSYGFRPGRNAHQVVKAARTYVSQGHDWVVDRELERQGHHFVGYADDVSIYVKSQRSGQRVLDSVSHFVSTHLKLTVSDKVPWRALRSAPSWGIR